MMSHLHFLTSKLHELNPKVIDTSQLIIQISTQILLHHKKYNVLAILHQSLNLISQFDARKEYF